MLEKRYCKYVDDMFKAKEKKFVKEKSYRSVLPKKLKASLHKTKTSMYA